MRKQVKDDKLSKEKESEKIKGFDPIYQDRVLESTKLKNKRMVALQRTRQTKSPRNKYQRIDE